MLAAAGYAELPAALSQSRAGWSTTRRRSGARPWPASGRRWPRPAMPPADDRGDRHHQPARDHHPLGARAPGGRSTTPSSGSAAAPRALCDRAEGRRGRARDPAEDRPGRRPVLLRHQDPLAARRGPGARARAERGRARLRHRRHVAALALTGRRGARHRPVERLAHALLRHPSRSRGTRGCAGSSACRWPLLPGCAPSAGRVRARPAAGRAAARASRWRASPATSRPRCSARRASSPAWPRTPTAPAASRCSTRARAPVASREGCSPPWRGRSAARPATRSRAACSSRARPCSGCATGSASSRGPTETQALAESVPDTGGVYLVPAFVGLGAPYWDPYARGTLVGITRGTTRAHLARAALEAIAYQSRDVLDAMARGRGRAARRRSGSTAAPPANDFLCQFQADMLGVEVLRPPVTETTGLGAGLPGRRGRRALEARTTLRARAGRSSARSPRRCAGARATRPRPAGARARRACARELGSTPSRTGGAPMMRTALRWPSLVAGRDGCVRARRPAARRRRPPSRAS